jgi:ribose 5-phosphate isomerase B
MKIYIASDHAGYELKKALIEYLTGKDQEVEDMGNKEHDSDDDYPDFIMPLAEKVAQDEDSVGIILGLTGNGEAIAANKVKGIRAAVCLNEKMAQKARDHNHANIISLGADYLDIEKAEKVVDTFLKTTFSKEERHIRRVEKISSYESAKS